MGLIAQRVGQNFVENFLGKEGAKILKSKGHFLSSGHRKNLGGVETPVRAMRPIFAFVNIGQKYENI